ncbi:unnamed protein product [Caenorhabditis brenneri]
MEVEKCNSLSLEDWPTLTQPVIKKREFKLIIPFHRLPLLVQVQAIQTMGPKDWINLAMTSKRNERVVKLTRLKTNWLVVQICQDACIQLPSLKLALFYDKTFWKIKKWECMIKEDIKTWLNQPFSSMVENAGILFQKIQNLFVFSNLKISFCTDIERKATIREFILNPVMKNWKNLTIYGKKISSEDLKMIMDTETSYRTFESKVEEMPLDFKHENAFKFFYQLYHDARWVKIEDLYGLRKLVHVDLYRNLFTQEQLKSFVNYWVNSKVDMFGWIQIISAESLNFDSFVDGLLGLQSTNLNYKLFFTLSKSPSYMRRNNMLIIVYDFMRQSLFLKAWNINKEYTPSKNEEENKKFENVGEILTLLHRKKDLEDLLEVANEEAKQELREKINERIAELSAFNVIFIDGKVTHQLF